MKRPAPLSPPAPSVFTLLNSQVIPGIQDVEIASSLQIPTFHIIGLPGPEVSEAKDRIRSAIESTGFEFPRRKLMLNLSPASVKKQGTGLDLAMALAVVIEGMRIAAKSTALFPYRRIFAWGELGLGGGVKKVGSPVRAIASALHGGADCLFVSAEEIDAFIEARTRLFPELSPDTPPIFGISGLEEALRFLESGSPPTTPSAAPANRPLSEPLSKPSSESSTGHSTANGPRKRSPGSDRRASDSDLLPLSPAMERMLRLAATGAHHFLLLGPKGAGKTHALEWFLSLQPETDLETNRMRSFLGEMSGKPAALPFRRVGTQARPAALLGSFSGGVLRPGELSLAHGGVLVADEFPEWSRDSREALREPLERGKLSLTRVDGAVELPSDFIFAGSGNLCPCGGIPSAPSDASDAACRCHPLDRMRYLSRLSGPILDRLDLVAAVLRRPSAPPSARRDPDHCARMRETVLRDREFLVVRFQGLPGKMSPTRLEEILTEHPALRTSLDGMEFRSFRDRHKTLRIALTLSALRRQDAPDARMLLEAKAIRTQADALLRPA